MSRGFSIFGEFIVAVSGGYIDDQQQLGLTSEPVKVFPRYSHIDKVTDDFGPEIPVEVFWMMGEALISMSLVHYDNDILAQCMRASMGGGGIDNNNPDGESDDFTEGAMDGFLGPAGRPLGYGRALGTAANQYTTVYLIPFTGASIRPYRFKACYINAQPMEIPLGSERSIVRLMWRCIPYQQLTSSEVKSVDGVPLWDRTSDIL